MNGLQAARAEARTLAETVNPSSHDILICPPATLLADLARDLDGTGVAVGGQDCHTAVSGAFTGEISAEMIKDAGGAYAIVGHSERRQYFAETDATVCEKAQAALRAGLTAIVCVGETEEFRRKGHHLAVVEAQVDGSVPRSGGPDSVVIAYEPVWAIGTGLTPTTEQISEMHNYIRGRLVQTLGEAWRGVQILYGGSVNPANAAEILSLDGVDGVLVGGASLKADSFAAIAEAAG